jgi:hypothetical protein
VLRFSRLLKDIWNMGRAVYGQPRCLASLKAKVTDL